MKKTLYYVQVYVAKWITGKTNRNCGIYQFIRHYTSTYIVLEFLDFYTSTSSDVGEQAGSSTTLDTDRTVYV